MHVEPAPFKRIAPLGPEQRPHKQEREENGPEGSDGILNAETQRNAGKRRDKELSASLCGLCG